MQCAVDDGGDRKRRSALNMWSSRRLLLVASGHPGEAVVLAGDDIDRRKSCPLRHPFSTDMIRQQQVEHFSVQWLCSYIIHWRSRKSHTTDAPPVLSLRCVAATDLATDRSANWLQKSELEAITMKAVVVVEFLLLVISCSAIACSSASGSETDRLSLLDFKMSITLDPQQALVSWNDSTNFCSWEGILCTSTHPRRVASVRLEQQGLVGHISPSLGNLTFLRNLSLARNQFTGEIPPSLGHLQQLQYLFLSNNTLQGRIPSFINCSSLRVVWMENNGLIGPFPAELPSGLHQLQISGNNLTGIIPASLSNITTLAGISCVYNKFVGNIPNEFSKLSNMQLLYMGANKLSGRFPKAVLNLSALTDLSLCVNLFSGEVPPNLGSVLRNLLLLELCGNLFHGPIPPSLGNASNLYYIELSRNNFSGVVPSTIGRLKKLEMLNLEYNQLQAENYQDWEFLDSLGNCTELIDFSLTGNRLEGHVPASLGNLTNKLQYLYLSKNQLSGQFPPGIANLRNLFIVSFGVNQFSGAIPEWLGALKNLQLIMLENNFFTGAIPLSFSNLSLLEELYLDSNQLSGQIPASFGNLPILLSLSISNNNLYGAIPKELFRIPTIVQIFLSYNKLDAPLHQDIGNAKQLTDLLLSSNKIPGSIPSTLGNCESLEDIELDDNDFSGNIPSSLGNIKTLQVLNLSQNNLTGVIPESLGRLQLLELLDLSFNNLKGEVPSKGIFMNATAMRIDGNQELCGGLPELHLLTCPVTPLDSVKHKPPFVLKIIIPVAIVVSLAIVIYALLLFQRRKQNRKSISLPSYGKGIPRISYGDLVRATEGFATSSLIGQGRYGSVYQGILSQDGNVIAIKVFSLSTRGAQKSFITECKALRNVRHRNLIPILTACSGMDSSGNDFKALVYEFMPKGDLHNLLYSARDTEGSPCLNYISLAQRLNILVDIADALEYLHHGYQETIVHCDLKPSNILLDNDMVAHVGDFGLAKFTFDSAPSSVVDSNSTSSIVIKGTIGYVAPGGGHVSTASDSYSFGVVLLEVFIRRRPTDDMFRDGMSIAKFAETNFPDNVLQIVDPLLVHELDVAETQILQSVLSVGLCCTKMNPNERTSMQEVAAKLHGIRDAGEIPISLGHLHHLQILNLDNNKLQGKIPALANCTNLKELSLGWNQLTGQIPEDFPNLLENLGLHANNLTGNIPASLGNITTLQSFSCAKNDIEGSIPNEIANLLGLQVLYVGQNKMSGQFPQPILNLSNLVLFSISFNNFSGVIPSIVGASLNKLQLFEIGVNFFHEHIPSSLVNASDLNDIDLSRNEFTGMVPSCIGRLSKLNWLNLEYNELHASNKKDWKFMDSLANCTELRIFSVESNNLVGKVPNSVGNLSSQLQ
ncbi:hypothetical protein U9M48_004911 [Paspalum notatum var. saurae]|uniref:Receptor kinase-like protein Xa21 n=1 Tax=Paspalum notatum var. saurae TaxID=547442 RepID=A0AAQ3SL56_PASNO